MLYILVFNGLALAIKQKINGWRFWSNTETNLEQQHLIAFESVLSAQEDMSVNHFKCWTGEHRSLCRNLGQWISRIIGSDQMNIWRIS